MDKKPLIVVSILAMVLLVLGSLSNVMGYQTVQTSQQNIIEERINQRELLFQTIVDIANNKEIQRIILKSQRSRGIFPTLLGLAVFHLLYLHLEIGVDNINFDTIVGRWTGPLGTFWRLYDLFLLIFAMTHGFNGSRYIIDDYIKWPGWRIVAKTISAVIAFMLWVMGAYIIFTLRLMGV